jgi:hypothetical protein
VFRGVDDGGESIVERIPRDDHRDVPGADDA